MLKKNIDGKGKIVRFCLGCILLLFAGYYKSWILLAFSLFTFFEVYMSWCVVYQFLGINQCPISDKGDKKNYD